MLKLPIMLMKLMLVLMMVMLMMLMLMPLMVKAMLMVSLRLKPKMKPLKPTQEVVLLESLRFGMFPPRMLDGKTIGKTAETSLMILSWSQASAR